MRKKIVAANWKMNKNFEEGIKLAKEINERVDKEIKSDVVTVLCAPYIHLHAINAILSDKIKLGAQNCYHKESGAYTGEISAEMLKSVGVSYVILGHSERREYFKETNEILAQKVNIALKWNIVPIFCVGETLPEREKGTHFNVIREQIEQGLFHLDENKFSKIVLAYEPVWAIGTGVNATASQAQEIHAYIRNLIGQKYSYSIAENISILYGGSCNPSNAGELFACNDIDGGLIGGASLEAAKFLDVLKAMK